MVFNLEISSDAEEISSESRSQEMGMVPSSLGNKFGLRLLLRSPALLHTSSLCDILLFATPPLPSSSWLPESTKLQLLSLQAFHVNMFVGKDFTFSDLSSFSPRLLLLIFPFAPAHCPSPLPALL